MRGTFLGGLLLFLVLGSTPAQDPPADAVETLVAQTKPALVAVRVEGRGRGGEARGSGFVIDESGIIATNLHVLGQARPVEVSFADGSIYPVVEVLAFDRNLDLALIRIEPEENGDTFPSLELSTEEIRQGSAVIAMGSPHGLDFSVTDGVVSSLREIDGNEMIQIALPIARGNSGGPLVNRAGKVVGVVTLKSAFTDNIGFAMPASAVQLLVDQPNPVAMENWLTIGSLDPARWEPLMGAEWTQRAGVLRVREMGAGFGGRSLCLRREQEEDDATYELSVEVKLDDEEGAAGLAFAADGEEAHYGFYPTAGRLRLTRFEGPSVYSWNIIEEIDSPAYRPGEWNHLRVRIEPERIRCFVNGVEVIDSTDTGLRGGRPGLCKFRSTEAEFARYRHGTDLAPAELDRQLAGRLRKEVTALVSPTSPAEVGKRMKRLAAAFESEPEGGRVALLKQARQLEEGAVRLRELADTVQRQAITDSLLAELDKPGGGSLAREALFLAQIDHPDLTIEPYLESLDRMATRVRELAGDEPSGAELVAALRTHLYDEQGFHGSRFDYENPANSHLNSVIDDREGIPISLSVVLIETGRRAGIEGLHGVGFPGHFLVSWQGENNEGAEAETQFLDVFDRAQELDRDALESLALDFVGRPLDDSDLVPSDNRAILTRMLRNLVGVTLESSEPFGAIRYLDVVLALDPDSSADRLARAGLRYRSGDRTGSRADLETLLEAEPEGINLGEIRRLLDGLDR